MEENSDLQGDLESQKQALESALAIGNELLKSCSEEDRPTLAEKLRNVKERYDKLNAKVGESEHYYYTWNGLMDWLTDWLTDGRTDQSNKTKLADQLHSIGLFIWC